MELSSSIQPVEMQHVAILSYVLGMYPGAQTASGTPLAFNPTSPSRLSDAGTEMPGQEWGGRHRGGGRPAAVRVRWRRLECPLHRVSSSPVATNSVTISNFMISPMATSVAPGSTVRVTYGAGDQRCG